MDGLNKTLNKLRRFQKINLSRTSREPKHIKAKELQKHVIKFPRRHVIHSRKLELENESIKNNQLPFRLCDLKDIFSFTFRFGCFESISKFKNIF